MNIDQRNVQSCCMISNGDGRTIWQPHSPCLVLQGALRKVKSSTVTKYSHFLYSRSQMLSLPVTSRQPPERVLPQLTTVEMAPRQSEEWLRCDRCMGSKQDMLDFYCYISVTLPIMLHNMLFIKCIVHTVGLFTWCKLFFKCLYCHCILFVGFCVHTVFGITQTKTSDDWLSHTFLFSLTYSSHVLGGVVLSFWLKTTDSSYKVHTVIYDLTV